MFVYMIALQALSVVMHLVLGRSHQEFQKYSSKYGELEQLVEQHGVVVVHRLAKMDHMQQ